MMLLSFFIIKANIVFQTC